MLRLMIVAQVVRHARRSRLAELLIPFNGLIVVRLLLLLTASWAPGFPPTLTKYTAKQVSSKSAGNFGKDVEAAVFIINIAEINTGIIGSLELVKIS